MGPRVAAEGFRRVYGGKIRATSVVRVSIQRYRATAVSKVFLSRYFTLRSALWVKPSAATQIKIGVRHQFPETIIMRGTWVVGKWCLTPFFICGSGVSEEYIGPKRPYRERYKI
jgi:hypothetical protein